MKSSVKYLSSGVNQTPRCIDWCGDTVAYAADTGIILYNPKVSKVVGASPKIHKNKVTSVRWIQPDSSTGQTFLVSTGADSSGFVWTVGKEEVEGLRTLQYIATLEHYEVATMSDGLVIDVAGEEKLLIVTAASEVVYCWIVCPVTGEKECRKAFTISNSPLITSLALMKVEELHYPLLLCGGHDSKIYIFSCDNVADYTQQAVLTGHEDWVTSLDVMREDSGGLLLASGSKDSSVRVWRFSVQKEAEALEEEDKKNRVLKLRSVVMQIKHSGNKYLTMSVLLDSLLAGHEGLVSQVCWARSIVKDGVQHQPYRLLSCSKTVDRAIIIWEPEEGADKGGGIWVEVARLGEVGGNMEGYFACQFSPDCAQVLGCSYQGALHMWENQNNSWEPCVVVGGHFKEVTDIAWDPQGRYLLSTSKDQTTRLHAPWRNSEETAWHEVGRPQVHGYDMACICSLGTFKFASGAEEKVIRGFSAPANSIRNFGQITGDCVKGDIDKCDVGEGASVPSLGLSNKSVMISDLEEGQQIQEQGREEIQAYFKPVSLTAPPTEDQLMQNTLWPEAAKLYGHGHDIIALAATSDGSILASSCRAAQEVDANIILWDAKKWQQADVLLKHRLTVTQMEFSSDDNYLLSVSRDRTWAIFKREPSENNAGITYKLSDSSKKKETMHARVIWSCAWLPDSKHFVTASRDKTVAVWSRGDDEGWTRVSLLNETDEVTAVAATVVESSEGKSQCLIATGLVNGMIKIRCYSIEESSFSTKVLQISPQHHRTVKRLKFKPSAQTCPVLASCGEDNRVQIYEILL
ncbi:elongator complex protein 2-like isoform X2 [Macrobrachium nipponense]|uniref:elongator complex protein 2-like isoform X2 n=1 Tax=Macrobrachium nipponense TaxID=159736 RepID=UPI0030C7A5F2